ncbi:MAG: alkaline phosphatase D family protein [Phycisphaeraceae bacterium]|nr:alkaline phosphatase D family protein [Phycisphaeraceae bacterium]
MSQHRGLSRRQFIGVSLASLPLVGVALAQNTSDAHPKAAVLEYADSWTRGARGAAVLLERAGFEVMPLSIDVVPDPAAFDLLFIGSFANRDQAYRQYVTRYQVQIRAFVAAGAVVVEMSQSAQRCAFQPSILPEGMEALRTTYANTNEVRVLAHNHPLMAPWADSSEAKLTYATPPGRQSGNDHPMRNWDSFAQWRGMRVLLADDPVALRYVAMLEGEHGKGRYLLSSLWLDKIVGPEGQTVAQPDTVRAAEAFFTALKDYVSLVRAGQAPPVAPTPMPSESWIGPMLGHIDHEQAFLWTRPDVAGLYTLLAWPSGQDRNAAQPLNAYAEPEYDRCIHWHLNDLQPDTEYQYRIERDGQVQLDGQTFIFRTAALPHHPVKVALALGSCTSSTDFPDLWQQIEHENVQGIVLLGDTPYIDSTDTTVNRIKHREFLSYPPIAHLVRCMPVWATWDDHDFGANDSDGKIENRDGLYQVFREYRAPANFGQSGEGIYTSFRRGPIELFLLDTRYFSQTAPSFADPAQPTLLGQRQWDWLCAGLKASDAPFKLIACGILWDDKKNKEKDDWETYAYERDALFDFIGREHISGVILIGGDIHVSRALRYKTEQRISYPLYEFVTSPMHDRILPDLNIPHPDLLFGQAEPNTFLKITADNTADPPTLSAEWIKMNGQRFHEITLTLDELSPRSAAALSSNVKITTRT